MKHKKTVLPNGLRIITVPMKESQTAIAMVLVEAGADYEDKKTNGLSHFLEHMCFKGTTNRTGSEIITELDGLGADVNAFTGEELTGYYAKARYRQVDKLLDIVSDMYINPIFPEKDIETERGVILQEINMNKDLPMRTVYDTWRDLLFPNQPAGRTTLGPAENIKKFKRSDFVKYHDTHYVPQKTVVIIAGNIDEKKIIKQVRGLFGNIKKGKVIKKIRAKNLQKSPAIKIEQKKTDQTHLIISFRTFDLYDKRNVCLALAATVLGKGFSSRLFKKMREELGMCYYVRANNYNYTDNAHFLVSTGVGNERAQEAVEVIIEEFKKLRDEKVLEPELKKAKDIILGKMATGLETSDSWSEYYGEQELHHEKMESPSEYAKRVRAITSEEIQRVLKQVIKNDRLNLAIVGPHKDITKFKKVLKV